MSSGNDVALVQILNEPVFEQDLVLFLSITPIVLTRAGSSERSKHVKYFVAVYFFGRSVHNLFGCDRRVHHALSPAHNLFVNLAVASQSQFLNQPISTESNGILNLPADATALVDDLEQPDEFVSVNGCRES